MVMEEMKIAEDLKVKLASTVRKWFLREGRHFEWRKNRTPYRVFVAEFLLKRTTSKAAERIYRRFLEKYPDIHSLANADITELEVIFKPIGLYKQRSKGIIEAAKYIESNFREEIPVDYEKLISIPHIGDYSACCILSFGMGTPVATVDSNVQRVLSRVFVTELQGDHRLKNIIHLASDLLPRDEHEIFNYGLIDLGATVCTYRKCCEKVCPLKNMCATYKNATKTL
jgi:A/G-specific adenine glycosylase